jgi:hypothetical protein
MSYAFVQDIPATWDTYLEIAEALGSTAPEGLVIHVAGPTEEGFRMIGIWDSRLAWDRFRDHRLRAMVEGLAGGFRMQPTYRELNIAHSMPGAAIIERWPAAAGGGLRD